MKKHLFAIMACALFAVSCVDIREMETGKSNDGLCLTAAVEQPAGTRTVLDWEPTRVLWEAGDEIKVFAGTVSAPFSSRVSDPVATTDFFGSLGGAWSEGSPLWAVYPYRDDASFDGEAVTTLLPSAQGARAFSFDKDINLSVARSTTASLQFYNVGGGVRFTLTGEGVRKVVLEGMNGETLAGKVRVGFRDDRPVVLDVTEGSTSISLTAPAGKSLEKQTWYYIVAVPGTLEKGFRLSFYKDGQVGRKVFDRAVEIKRSIYGGIERADEAVAYEADPDANITFKDGTVKSIVVRYFDTGKDGELSYAEAAAVRSFLVDEALTRADGGLVSVFAGTGITTFPEIVHFTGLTKIDDGAFAGCASLTSVTIPEFITEIGAHAFEGCTSLTAVTIPAGVTQIGADAFRGCTGLQSVTALPATPPTLGAGAFSDTNECPIVVPVGTTEAYASAWSGYAPRIEGAQPDNEIWYTSSDGKPVIPAVEDAFGATILSNTYSGGKGVIVFDEPIDEIGSQAFWGCTTLTGITIPSKVSFVRQYAFSGCTNLASVGIPESVRSIENRAFRQCTSLTEVVLPKNITNISYGLFHGCSALTSIEIPTGVEYISEQAFCFCSNLAKVDIPETVTEIGPYAFYECSKLRYIKVPSGVTRLEEGVFSGCIFLLEIEIPAGVTSIGSEAFYQCRSMFRVEIPAGVTSIGTEAFHGCPQLRTVVSLIQTPFAIDESVFDHTYIYDLYVPAGTIDLYKTTPGWNQFVHFRELEVEEPLVILREEFERCLSYLYYCYENLRNKATPEEAPDLYAELEYLFAVLDRFNYIMEESCTTPADAELLNDDLNSLMRRINYFGEAVWQFILE